MKRKELVQSSGHAMKRVQRLSVALIMLQSMFLAAPAAHAVILPVPIPSATTERPQELEGPNSTSKRDPKCNHSPAGLSTNDINMAHIYFSLMDSENKSYVHDQRNTSAPATPSTTASRSNLDKATKKYNESFAAKRFELCLRYYGGIDYQNYTVKGSLKNTEDYSVAIKKPVCGTNDDGCKKAADQIESLRKDANKKYVEYMKAKYEYEDCSLRKSEQQAKSSTTTTAAAGMNGSPINKYLKAAVNPDPAGTPMESESTVTPISCGQQYADVKTKTDELEGLIKNIAMLEQLIAKGQYFRVTEFFKYPGQTVNTSVQSLSNKVAEWLFLLLGSVAVTAFMIGGVFMIISKGNEERLTQGKTIFEYTIIGVIITLLSYAIVKLIQNILYSGSL